MAALLRQSAWRIGGSALQRTQAAVTSPAVVEERRRLVTRRLTTGEKRSPNQEYLEKKYGHLKPHQICWMLLKCFPVGKAFGLAAMTTVTVAYIDANRQLEMEEAAKKKADEMLREH